MLSVPAYRARVARWLTPWAWAAVVLALVALVRVGRYTEADIRARHAEAFLVPWLLVGTVLTRGGGRAGCWRSGRSGWVGRLSYSLYMWQQLADGGPEEFRPFALGPLQELPLNLLVPLGCAAVSYYLVEKPTIRLGSRLAKAVVGLEAGRLRRPDPRTRDRRLCWGMTAVTRPTTDRPLKVCLAYLAPFVGQGEGRRRAVSRRLARRQGTTCYVLPRRAREVLNRMTKAGLRCAGRTDEVHR